VEDSIEDQAPEKVSAKLNFETKETSGSSIQAAVGGFFLARDNKIPSV
jgi:hypothetical protein